MSEVSATHRVARSRVGAFNLLGSVVNRLKIASKDFADAAEANRSNGSSIAERQEELRTFYTRYEDLVETLCDSAQFGPTPKLERMYDEHRVWMQANYPSIRRFVGAYLRCEEGDTVDAFEALVSDESLSAFLSNDDGDMIGRITSTREALNLYGEHLRQLAARNAA